MTKLSPEAQALLDKGRDALTPDTATKERVLNSLDASLAGASTTAGSGGFVTGKLWLALTLAAGIAGGLLVFGQQEGSQRPARAPIETAVAAEPEKAPVPEAEPAPNPAPPAAVIEPSAATDAPAVAAVTAVAAKPKKSTKPQRVEKNNLLAERTLIAAAQTALRKKNYREARELLGEHKSQFPRGVLGPEREAALAMANCLDEDGKSGKAIARRFLESHPSSPLAPRVRKSCELE
ncbi:MAG: outer membrane protein assembly factor BamD [Myxococcales bacterium]|nr:outer membrane protein assembly factor BamD [Myxococcales bacterium]